MKLYPAFRPNHTYGNEYLRLTLVYETTYLPDTIPKLLRMVPLKDLIQKIFAANNIDYMTYETLNQIFSKKMVSLHCV